jgi:shikimate kinase
MPSNLPPLQGVSIFLIGMMGVGKSTVGKILAQKLGYGFCDTDTLLERACGLSIAELFRQVGEQTFRQLESQVLAEVSAHTRLVVATGGGIVLRRENWGYLHHGVVVWLDMPTEEIMARLQRHPQQLAQRPVLHTPDPLATLTALAQQRRALYAEADIHVGANAEPQTVSDRIINLLHSHLKPWHPPSSSESKPHSAAP